MARQLVLGVESEAAVDEELCSAGLAAIDSEGERP